jgi:hypothetical protein
MSAQHKSAALPSDLILAAAEADRSIVGATFGYMTMSALPGSLRQPDCVDSSQ